MKISLQQLTPQLRNPQIPASWTTFGAWAELRHGDQSIVTALDEVIASLAANLWHKQT